MESHDQGEEKLLRSAALQNAQSILVARQRVEQELVQAKETLELKTQELAHSLAMLQATLEATTDAILVTDERRQVRGFNEKFMQMLRIPRDVMDSKEHETVLGVVAPQLIAPQSFLARTADIYASWPPETFDVLEFADGRVLERYSKTQRIGERPVGRVWCFRDITERRGAGITARRLAAIVDSSEDAIVGKDLNGVVTSWNVGAERIFGYSASEMIGSPITRLIPPDRQAEEDQILSHIRRGLRVEHFETVRVAKGGWLLDVSVTISPIKDAEGKVIGASKIARDITDRRRAENRLKAAKSSAEQANKAKDHFLAVLSHELRTPLTPALVAASYLVEHEDLPVKLREVANTIQRNMELEARLIDDLLDLTRITHGKVELHLEPVDVHQLLRNTLEIVREDIVQKQLHVVMDLGARDHHVNADRVRMQQVFWNLINNAAKFTANEGRITIRSLNDERGRFVCEVTDTGIGIDPDKQGRVFKAFEQGERSTTRQFGGLGLGLAISKTLLDLHGGTISVHSQGTNQGTSFKVTLEVLAKSQIEVRPPTEVTAGKSPSLQILLVDDHADTLSILAMLLRKRGHQIFSADCVEGALKLLDKEKIDVLISDIGLRDGSGYELMRQAKVRQPIKGIALSGFGTGEDVRRSLEAGFHHHLAKPVSIQVLESCLRDLAS